ncbi:hypothetical protein EJB05_47368 [Eragrostis curvula]|uniref:Uncharacterized protein n=1 Tax=Eragrostis curvula TaxID=38414 RepID=A0A5J9T8M0_9POAL|nr:hypothetical protein EJB05_47368 [Eragrostis curvula]
MNVSSFSFIRNIEIERQDAMQRFSSMCRRGPTLLINWCFIHALGEMVKDWRKLGERLEEVGFYSVLRIFNFEWCWRNAEILSGKLALLSSVIQHSTLAIP